MSGVLDAVLEHDAVKGDMVEEVDAVIVGTGCGGAVVAKELAGAGWSVLLLERGGLHHAGRGDFDQREDDMMAKIDGGRGLDTTSDGGTALTYGNTVGGASVHYWADTYRTPRDRCERWAIPGRGYDDLAPYFDRIERDLNVHRAPDARMNRMNQLFEKACGVIGVETERVPNARKDCIGSGYCMQGCAYDAKQSQLVTHLPQALARGARIFADCEVHEILVENGRAVGLHAQFLDRRTCKPSGHTLRVKARRAVVVAAGGFHTAPLLLKSGVADASGQLGKNLQMNPGMRTFGIFDEDIVLWRNIPAAVGSLQFRLAQYDDTSGAYVDGGFQLYPDQIQPATLAACIPGWGDAHRDLMQTLHRIGAVTSWIDEKNAGSVELVDGAPVWHFALGGEDVAKFRRAIKLHARILLAAGAREVVVPDGTFTRRDGKLVVGGRIRGEDEIDRVVDGADLRPGSILYAAPHPAGAARMGVDARHSVVDPDGQVWSTRALWVADPSAFPSVVSVDPSETIMAWSYVTAAKILASS